MCVHDQTSPPDDHSAWKKKTQLAFDPERERAKLNSVKIDSPVFCDWWTASHLIYMNCGQFNIKKKKTLNNTWIMHLSSGNLKLLGYAYKKALIVVACNWVD